MSCSVGLGQWSIPRKHAIARSPFGHMDMDPCFRPICIPGEKVYLWVAPPLGISLALSIDLRFPWIIKKKKNRCYICLRKYSYIYPVYDFTIYAMWLQNVCIQVLNGDQSAQSHLLLLLSSSVPTSQIWIPHLLSWSNYRQIMEFHVMRLYVDHLHMSYS